MLPTPTPTGKSLESRCSTCRFNETHRFTIAGKLTESRHCARHVPIFPDAMYCQLYEREPGAD